MASVAFHALALIRFGSSYKEGDDRATTTGNTAGGGHAGDSEQRPDSLAREAELVREADQRTPEQFSIVPGLRSIAISRLAEIDKIKKKSPVGYVSMELQQEFMGLSAMLRVTDEFGQKSRY